MSRVMLTDRFVASAKPGASGRAEYFDAAKASKGLSLRVSAGGRKSWSFFFSSPKDGKRARLTLGSYPATPLAKARTLAIEAAVQIDDGMDPRDTKDANAVTIAMLAGSYFVKHVRPNLRTAKNIEQRFKKNVVPIIGDLRIGDLHRRDINRVLDPIIARSSPVEAIRVYAFLSAMFRWATKRGDIDVNPMAGMGKPSTEAEPRERHLSDSEIRIVWNALPAAITRSVACQRILKLCLVTAQRVGEVSGMRRDELDLEKKIWSLPPARVKNATAHAVPLSELALEIIRDALADAGEASEFVFPSPAAEDFGGKPINPHAVGRSLARAQRATKERPRGKFAIPIWTAHDLRRTAITHLAQLAVPPIAIAAIVNHRSVTKSSVTFKSYARYDYAREKAEALNLWAERLGAIIAGGAAEVVPLIRENVTRA